MTFSHTQQFFQKRNVFVFIFQNKSVRSNFFAKFVKKRILNKNIRKKYSNVLSTFSIAIEFQLLIRSLLFSTFESNEKNSRFHFLLTKRLLSRRTAILILLSNKNWSNVAFFTHVKSNSMLSIFDSFRKMLKTCNSFHTWSRKSLILHFKRWKIESFEKTKLRFWKRMYAKIEQSFVKNRNSKIVLSNCFLKFATMISKSTEDDSCIKRNSYTKLDIRIALFAMFFVKSLIIQISNFRLIDSLIIVVATMLQYVVQQKYRSK